MAARWATRGRRVTRDHMSATERALAESNERYRSLFAYNPHAAFSLDAAMFTVVQPSRGGCTAV